MYEKDDGLICWLMSKGDAHVEMLTEKMKFMKIDVKEEYEKWLIENKLDVEQMYKQWWMEKELEYNYKNSWREKEIDLLKTDVKKFYEQWFVEKKYELREMYDDWSWQRGLIDISEKYYEENNERKCAIDAHEQWLREEEIRKDIDYHFNDSNHASDSFETDSSIAESTDIDIFGIDSSTSEFDVTDCDSPTYKLESFDSLLSVGELSGIGSFDNDSPTVEPNGIDSFNSDSLTVELNWIDNFNSDSSNDELNEIDTFDCDSSRDNSNVNDRDSSREILIHHESDEDIFEYNATKYESVVHEFNKLRFYQNTDIHVELVSALIWTKLKLFIAVISNFIVFLALKYLCSASV